MLVATPTAACAEYICLRILGLPLRKSSTIKEEDPEQQYKEYRQKQVEKEDSEENLSPSTRMATSSDSGKYRKIVNRKGK